MKQDQHNQHKKVVSYHNTYISNFKMLPLYTHTHKYPKTVTKQGELPEKARVFPTIMPLNSPSQSPAANSCNKNTTLIKPTIQEHLKTQKEWIKQRIKEKGIGKRTWIDDMGIVIFKKIWSGLWLKTNKSYTNLYKNKGCSYKALRGCLGCFVYDHVVYIYVCV